MAETVKTTKILPAPNGGASEIPKSDRELNEEVGMMLRKELYKSKKNRAYCCMLEDGTVVIDAAFVETLS